MMMEGRTSQLLAYSRSSGNVSVRCILVGWFLDLEARNASGDEPQESKVRPEVKEDCDAWVVADLTRTF
jgi:hypothetical protein